MKFTCEKNSKVESILNCVTICKRYMFLYITIITWQCKPENNFFTLTGIFKIIDIRIVIIFDSKVFVYFAKSNMKDQVEFTVYSIIHSNFHNQGHYCTLQPRSFNHSYFKLLANSVWPRQIHREGNVQTQFEKIV